MPENPILEWLQKLRRIGRKLDSFTIEKVDTQKYPVQLFERGEFIESIILHCQDAKLDSIVAELEGETKNTN